MHRTDGAGHQNNQHDYGNLSEGREATEVTADWLNAVQEEVANVIEHDEGVLDKQDNTQLLTKILALANDAKFPSGTKMLFIQAAAPTGWTKVTDHNNKALRIVSGGSGGGTGGSVDFTAALKSQSVGGSVENTTATGSVTVDNRTVTESQSTPHKHKTGVRISGSTGYGASGSQDGGSEWEFNGAEGGETNPYTSSTGGGSGHDHSASFSGTAHGHTFNGTAIDMAVKYVDTIICEKD